MSANAWNVLCVTVLLAADFGGLYSPGNGEARADTAPLVTSTSSPAVASSTDAASSTSSSAATDLKKLWSSEDQPTHRRSQSGVPNFGQLDEHVWRSGQPSRKGFQTLADLHIKTIVNLRAEFPQEKDLVPAGVNYVQIPITDETAPTEEQANQFLRIVTNPANWPVLVHCRAGEGRTGVMCALVRYSIDGWDHRKILTESDNFEHPILGLIKTRLCGKQQRFLKQWEGNNQPGAYQKSIGAQ